MYMFLVLASFDFHLKSSLKMVCSFLELQRSFNKLDYRADESHSLLSIMSPCKHEQFQLTIS